MKMGPWTAVLRRYVPIAAAALVIILAAHSTWYHRAGTTFVNKARIRQAVEIPTIPTTQQEEQQAIQQDEQQSTSTSTTQPTSIEQQGKSAVKSVTVQSERVEPEMKNVQKASTTKPPPDTTKPPPDTTKPPPDTTKPPPDTTKPPPDITKPSPATTKPPPDTTKPPPDTTKPQLPKYNSNQVSPSTNTSHWLDISASGWLLEDNRLDVTSVYAEDKQHKQVDQFTIDPLVDFFPQQINRRNFDNSTYQNWMSMKFPPNSNWDQGYKTPCYADYKTSNFRCIPHIYIVGWAKSGTTDLWWYLNRHPQLVYGYKETQFLTQFSFWENHKDMKTFDQLLRFFDKRSVEQQKGHPERVMYDATATIIYDNWHWRIKQGYAGDPHVPTHTNFHYLRKIHPQAQIVVLMRNPVTRALSFYNHGVDMTINKNANLGFRYVQTPESSLDIHKFFVDSIRYFNECVRKTSLRACCHKSGWESQHWGDPKYFMTLRIGIYYIFLEEVYKNYSPSQVHLIKSEEFYEEPTSTLTDLYTFMNISTQSVPNMVQEKGTYIVMSIRKYFTPLPDTYRLLQQFYAPFNKRLAHMLGDEKWLKWEDEIHRHTEKL